MSVHTIYAHNIFGVASHEKSNAIWRVAIECAKRENILYFPRDWDRKSEVPLAKRARLTNSLGAHLCQSYGARVLCAQKTYIYERGENLRVRPW